MGISLLLGFLLTRQALATLSVQSSNGREAFGVLMLFIAVAGAANFLIDGFQKALVRFLALRTPTEDGETDTHALFASGWVLSAGVGWLIAATIALFGRDIIGLLSVPSPLVADAYAVLVAIAVANGITATLQPWRAAMLAEDKYAAENARIVVEKLFALGGVTILHMSTSSTLMTVALVWQGAQPVTLACMTLCMRLTGQSQRLRIRSATLQHARELFSLSGWSSLISVASTLYERADQVLINVLIGPAYNAFYALALQVQANATSLVTSITSVMLPTASRLASGGNRLEHHQFLIRATRYVLTISTPAALLVAFYADDLVTYWVGPHYREAADVLPLAMLVMLSRAPNHVGWTYLTAMNRLKWPALVMILDAVTNVALSIFYVKVLGLGLRGVVLGTLSTSLLRFGLFQIPYLAAVARLPLRTYWRSAILQPLIGTAGMGGALMMLSRADLPTAAQVTTLFVIGGGYGIWIWVALFDSYERSLVIYLFRQVTAFGTRRSRESTSIR